jgi:dihydrofolate reductase
MLKNYKIIVAYDDKKGIGKDLDIPWYIPEDLKRLKKLTLNQNIIMGSKTYQSIINRIGKPLPQRNTIVLSKKITNSDFENCRFFNSYQEIINEIDSAWIFGGSEIYKLFLDYSKEIYVTKVKGDYNCNIFFPEIEYSQWNEEVLEIHENYSYIRYIKKCD